MAGMRSAEARVDCEYLGVRANDLSYAGVEGRRRRAYVCRKKGAPNYGAEVRLAVFFARCWDCPENTWGNTQDAESEEGDGEG